LRTDIVVTGGLGYLGSVLVGNLAGRGFRVKVIDNESYGNQTLKALRRNIEFTYVNCDVRDASRLKKHIDHTENLVHLAAIVGDPACAINENLSWSVNYGGTLAVATAAKKAGLRRMLYASSCSIYGYAQGEVNEESSLNPLSIYAESRVRSEASLMDYAKDGLSVTALRMPTLFGPSPRMRFDLVVNFFAANAYKFNRITVEGGTQWRPFLHVTDAAEAYVRALEVPPTHPFETYNVGGDKSNYRIADIANLVKKTVPSVRVEVNTRIQDNRSYSVSFKKIKDSLGYSPTFEVQDGVRQIVDAFKRQEYPDFPAAKYSNVEMIKAKETLLGPLGTG
jgi:nucleoside-diphosphate-sugar epimerase